MNVTSAVRAGTKTGMPPALGLVAAVAGVVALLGVYWDDSWHTDTGRDDFWIPPHMTLYSGVLVAALAVAAWGVTSWRSQGWGLRGLVQVLRDPALLLAGIGGLATLASAPLDDLWHRMFGRDAVIWSPPHLLAVVATFALTVGLLAGLANTSGRLANPARVIAGAGVLGALQVPVLEYDSDVPQFDAVWYLPVATLGLAAAFVILHDLLGSRRQLLGAAALYTVFRLGVVGFLAALDHSLTVVPPVLVVLLLVLGVTSRAGGMARQLALLGLLTPVTWWLASLPQSQLTTTVPAADLIVAVPLSVAAALLVGVLHGTVRVPPIGSGQRGAVVTLALAVVTLSALIAPAGQALAHDPGQGDPLREGRLTVTHSGDTARLSLVLPTGCADLQPTALVARRAGVENRGTLTALDEGGRCEMTGEVPVDDRGRWFVYAELDSAAAGGGASDKVEAWLPVRPGETVAEDRVLYQPPAPQEKLLLRNLLGGVLLLAVLGLLAAAVRLARRVGAARSPVGARP